MIFGKKDQAEKHMIYQSGRMAARQIDELVGLCKGAILDGAVSQGEAEYILTWLESNRECSDTWPASVLYPRIRDMLKDERLDLDEQAELLDILVKLAGGKPDGSNASTDLPLDNPQPSIEWNGCLFCVTGVFSYGPRSKVHEAIEAMGGLIASGIKKDLDYLVIGSIGTDAWKHSSFGNKIIKAMDYKSSGCPISIISESHWQSCL